MDYLGMTARYTRRGETSRLEIRETEKLSPLPRFGREISPLARHRLIPIRIRGRDQESFTSPRLEQDVDARRA